MTVGKGPDVRDRRAAALGHHFGHLSRDGHVEAVLWRLEALLSVLGAVEASSSNPLLELVSVERQHAITY